MTSAMVPPAGAAWSIEMLGTKLDEGVVAAIDRVVAGQERLAAPLDTLTNERRMRRFSQATMEWLKIDTVVEVAALLELPRRLPSRQAMPAQTSYAMAPSAILAIVEQIQQRSPRRVVECGSGMSTLWIGYALEQAGGGRLYSLEHLRRYADEVRERVLQHGLQHSVEVLDAPLAPWDLDGAEQPWYGPQAVAAIPDGIDLLLVDGPPESTGPQARYPAIPLLAGKLADGALVILDDADRPDEKEIVARWRERFPGLGEPFKLGSRTVAMEYRA